MSMARCDQCSRVFDTDEDPEGCYNDGFVCEACRPEEDEE